MRGSLTEHGAESNPITLQGIIINKLFIMDSMKYLHFYRKLTRSEELLSAQWLINVRKKTSSINLFKFIIGIHFNRTLFESDRSSSVPRKLHTN